MPIQSQDQQYNDAPFIPSKSGHEEVHPAHVEYKPRYIKQAIGFDAVLEHISYTEEDGLPPSHVIETGELHKV